MNKAIEQRFIFWRLTDILSYLVSLLPSEVLLSIFKLLSKPLLFPARAVRKMLPRQFASKCNTKSAS